MNIWADANGWPVPPIILLGCLVAEILYYRGWRMLVKAEQARQAARAKTAPVSTGFDIGGFQGNSWLWRGVFFLGAMVTFLLAASAPVDILSARLFWVHMVQHLLLLVVMAPLLVAGAPLLPMWLGLPRQARRLFKACIKLQTRRALYRLGGWLRQPAITCALLVIGTWAWHWPPLYDLALTGDTITSTPYSHGLHWTHGLRRCRNRSERCSGSAARICSAPPLRSLCPAGHRERWILRLARSATRSRHHVDVW